MTRPHPRPHDVAPRSAVAAAGIAVAAVVTLWLTGCSAVPPTRFHTLMPAPAASASKSAPAGAIAWEVLAVSVPAQVDQPQWVVRTADGGLAVLEQERWIAPLGEEIHAAVTDRLTQVVGASAPSAAPANQWRILIDVQRFESIPGKEARLEAVWTLSAAGAPAAALRCRAEFVQSVATGSGYLTLANGHQQGVAQLADAIGVALKARGAGQAAVCA
jgi:uncharacterized protein